MAHLLLIDDDPDLILEQVLQVFPSPAHRVGVAGTGAQGIEKLRGDLPDVILLDLRLPDQSGIEVFQQIRRIDARIPVVFITMTKGADTAIEAMKQGAYDYLFKPVGLHQLQRVLGEAIEVARRMREPARLVDATDRGELGGDSILGACPAMQEVYKAIGRVASQDVPVLISGDSGTGKELVARAIYQHSSRATEPFLALNCAAIPETLLESELFGHEKGAFTGADRRRIGKFEQCNCGTIFLDEVGDMPSALQAKILRVLQEQAFERVGGNETITTNVRIITATHRDLKRASEDGRFRLDLYYRLSVFTVHLPPLSERGDDLPMLVRHYVRRFGREMGKNVADVAPAVIDRLRDHHWPGNIRELQNVLRQALLRAQGQVLLPEFLPELPRTTQLQRPTGVDTPRETGPSLETFVRKGLAAGSEALHEDAHRWVDRILLPLVLEHTQGNQRQAARILGIARKTLRDRLRELGITIQRSLDLGDGADADDA
jgi:two-component system nitrogen regulation response regulator GlnG